MQLVVNAVTADVDDAATVADVVRGLAGVDRPARRRRRTERCRRPACELGRTRPADGDTIDVLTAVQGG